MNEPNGVLERAVCARVSIAWLSLCAAAVLGGSLQVEAQSTSTGDLTGAVADQGPGVEILPTDGLAGSGARIRIRGLSTLGPGNDPLVFVDGVQVNGDPGGPNLADSTRLRTGRLGDVNPDDIARIEVLRGTAQTARYGPGAANGVVLVTMRPATGSGLQWSAYGQGSALSEPDRHPADNFTAWGHTNDVNHTLTTCPLTAQAAGSCTLDSLTRFNPLTYGPTSPTRIGYGNGFGLRLSHAGPALRVLASADHTDQTGTFVLPHSERVAYDSVTPLAFGDNVNRPNTDTRTHLRGLLGANLGPTFELTGTAAGQYTTHRAPDNPLLADMAAVPSTFPSGVGSWGARTSLGFRPAALFASQAADNATQAELGTTATWRPSTWLTARAIVGFDQSVESDTLLATQPPISPPLTQVFETHTVARDLETQWTADVNATAALHIGPHWALTTTVGLQNRDSRSRQHLVDTLGLLTNGQLSNPGTVLTELSIVRLSRAAYVEQRVGYDDRLWLTAGVSASHDRQYITTSNSADPHVSISWAPASGLRMHAAYGTARDEWPPLELALLFSFTPCFEYVGGGVVGGVVAGCTSAAPNFPSPPRVVEYEAGADASLWASRVTVGATVYDRATHGATLFVPGFQGSVFPLSYAVRNRGIEGDLTATPLTGRPVRWDATLAASVNTNRLVSIPVSFAPFALAGGPQYIAAPGYPLYGIWESPLQFADANHDGVISPTEVSASGATRYQGTPFPTRIASLGTTLAFLGDRLRVSTVIDYVGGQSLIDPNAALQMQFGTARANNDRRASLADQAAAVALTQATPNYYGPVQDGSFVRWREVSATLALPAQIARGAWSRTMTVGLAVRNLALSTRYTGVDPEVNTSVAGTDAISALTAVAIPREWILRVTLGN